MNLLLLSTSLPLADHMGLGKCLFSFAVLSLKNAVGMLRFGFPQLCYTLPELLGKTLQFQTSLSQQASHKGLDNFVLF